jgi:hypothetical protein
MGSKGPKVKVVRVNIPGGGTRLVKAGFGGIKANPVPVKIKR